MASTTTQPISISLTKLHCVETQGDQAGFSSDEVYAVFFIADLTAFPVPRAIARESKLFRDIDDGDSENAAMILWGIDGNAAPVSNPRDVLVLAGLMENDTSSRDAVLALVQSVLSVALGQLMANGTSRPALASRLIKLMNGALDSGAATGGRDMDERLGMVKEFQLNNKHIEEASRGKAVHERLTFHPREGGHYWIELTIAAGKSHAARMAANP